MIEKTMDKFKPKISFGIIVLNGEPFIKYCLRALYPFAHEILVVEGAIETVRSISTSDGHSTDTTRESILGFIKDEDPHKKVKFITRDGFWKEKDEMSQAYARAATGDYLWQIDVDEFYLEEDMSQIIKLLENDPTISGISFKMKSFWGGVDYTEEGPIFGDIYRIFKFGPGYRYTTHEPPVVLDDQGRNLKKMNWIDGYAMQKNKIFMYHYSLVFPGIVREKARFYEKLGRNKKFIEWANENYFKLAHPYHVNINFWKISWLRRYTGRHNQQIVNMMKDIHSGLLSVEVRNSDDIEKLMASWVYKITTSLFQFYVEFLFILKRQVKKLLKK